MGSAFALFRDCIVSILQNDDTLVETGRGERERIILFLSFLVCVGMPVPHHSYYHMIQMGTNQASAFFCLFCEAS